MTETWHDRLAPEQARARLITDVRDADLRVA